MEYEATQLPDSQNQENIWRRMVQELEQEHEEDIKDDFEYAELLFGSSDLIAG